jgi:hypothetical protein
MSELKTGFTGELEDPAALTVRARKAGQAVQREASAVIGHAADRPAGTGVALLSIAALAFLAGYALRPTPRSRTRFW